MGQRRNCCRDPPARRGSRTRRGAGKGGEGRDHGEAGQRIGEKVGGEAGGAEVHGGGVEGRGDGPVSAFRLRSRSRRHARPTSAAAERAPVRPRPGIRSAATRPSTPQVTLPPAKHAATAGEEEGDGHVEKREAMEGEAMEKEGYGGGSNDRRSRARERRCGRPFMLEVGETEELQESISSFSATNLSEISARWRP